MLKKDLIYQIIQLKDHYPQKKNKRMIVLMKDELSGKILTEFVGLRQKTCSYLIDDDAENKTVKGTKKCVVKGILKFEDKKKK